MMNHKSKNIVVLIGAVAIVVVAFLCAVLPFTYFGSIKEETVAKSDLMQKLLTQARKISDRNRDPEQEKSGSRKPLFLQGDTTGIAGANLQRRITTLINSYGGQARSFQILPPEKTNALTRISMSLSVQLDINSLQKILFDIETRTPLIFIDDLVIRTTGSRVRRGNRYRPQALSVTMKVSGYLSGAKTQESRS